MSWGVFGWGEIERTWRSVLAVLGPHGAKVYLSKFKADCVCDSLEKELPGLAFQMVASVRFPGLAYFVN